MLIKNNNPNQICAIVKTYYYSKIYYFTLDDNFNINDHINFMYVTRSLREWECYVGKDWKDLSKKL